MTAPSARRAPLARAALVGPVLLAACGGGVGERRALVELEHLAFVPPARCVLPGFSGPHADCSLERAIVMDRFEVTRGEWARYAQRAASGAGAGFDRVDAAAPAERGAARAREERAAWGDETLAWPAHMSQLEAREFARWRGMRLPTAREWIHVAVGARALKYPWGPRFQRSIANTLELGLNRPAAVGTFERGRSGTHGCYDLVGNVWEWVADRVPGRGEAPEGGFADAPGAAGRSGAPEGTGAGGARLVSAMGGSYLYRAVETYGPPAEGRSSQPVFNALTLDPATRSPDIGVRCAADAEEYLWSRAREWGSDDEARARLRAVGRGWGREALPLLERLAAREGAPPTLAWLAEGARM